jgi:hypothetical protein
MATNYSFVCEVYNEQGRLFYTQQDVIIWWEQKSTKSNEWRDPLHQTTRDKTPSAVWHSAIRWPVLEPLRSRSCALLKEFLHVSDKAHALLMLCVNWGSRARRPNTGHCSPWATSTHLLSSQPTFVRYSFILSYCLLVFSRGLPYKILYASWPVSS